MNRYFTKEDIRLANMRMKRCSTSSVSGRMEIKITVTYHCTPIRMVCEDVEKLKFYTLVVGMQNGTAILEISLVVSFKVEHLVTI